MSIFSFLDGIMDPILDPLKNILMGLVKLAEFVLSLLGLFFKLIFFSKELLNPTKLLNDLIGGVKASLILVYKFFMNALGGSTIYNKIIPKSLSGGGGIFGLKGSSSQGTCIQPTMLRLILMIVCPPFALFMKIGLANWGWFYITTCTILTIYGYYFPGLIYAAMHILC